MAKHKKPRKRGPRREPVAWISLAPILVTIAAYAGLELDARTAAEIIGGIVYLATVIRSLVSPANLDEGLH